MISTRGTETYTLDKEMDKKIAYIMQNGYPNKRFSNDEDKDYCATALSIWYVLETDPTLFRHFDLNNGTYRGTSNDVVKIMAQLINGANSYSYTNPSIKINNSNRRILRIKIKSYFILFVALKRAVSVSGELCVAVTTSSIRSRQRAVNLRSHCRTFGRDHGPGAC